MLPHTARNLTRKLTLLTAMSLLGACSSQGRVSPGSTTPPIPVAQAPVESTTGERAAAVAVRQIGVPYRYGGVSTSGFDCSGLVHFSYARAGKKIPRTTKGLWQSSRPITHRELQPGDVLFFDIEGKMSHVGLYLGEGRFVHAPASGRRVSIEALDSDFYRQALIRGGRP
jgi:cell wall-associated NlpC family hydrolase